MTYLELQHVNFIEDSSQVTHIFSDTTPYSILRNFDIFGQLMFQSGYSFAPHTSAKLHSMILFGKNAFAYS